MSELSKIRKNGVDYDIKDSKARSEIEKLKENGAGGNANQGGMTAEQISALDGMFKVCAFTKADISAEYTAFKAAFGISGEPDEPDAEKTLTSISATYSGGSVAVGTAVNALTGIAVTAHYSDGTSETVTGYTLSGAIAEGENTVTVSYGGKTTTFVVVGVASGEDEPTEPLYGVFWPPKGAVLDWNVPEWDDVDNFAYTGNTGSEYINAGLPGGAFVRLDKLQGTVYIRTLTQNQYGVMEQGCYEVYANSDGEIATGGFEKVPTTVYRQFGGKEKTMEVNGTTYCFMMFKFEIPAGQTGYFVSTANAMSSGYFVSSDLTGIDDEYKPYYTLFGSDPSDRITEPATEVE